MLKWFFLLLIALVVGGLVAVTLYLGPNDMRRCDVEPDEKCPAADAIVVVSGGDTKARVDRAVMLYQNGWAPLLVFSGAAQDIAAPSNAAVMREQALAAGVARSDIIIEEASRNTEENAQNVARALSSRAPNSIILVTSAYHQRRAMLEFEQALGRNVEIINAPVTRDRHWYGPWWWTNPVGWWLVGSELVGIVVHHAGGQRW